MQCECGNPEMKYLYTEPTRFSCFWCKECGRLGWETMKVLKFGLSVCHKGIYEKQDDEYEF